MFVVCLCYRFLENPKESQLSSIKRILSDLTDTQQIGLWYPKGVDCDLVGYTDSDFAGCKLDRKNISDTCHLLGNSLVFWYTKK